MHDTEIFGDGLDSDAAIALRVRSERDAQRLIYDGTDRPTPGTWCALCRLKGGAILAHYCPAKGYLGEWPVCEACGSSATCGHAAAIERMQCGVAMFEADIPFDPGHGVDVSTVREVEQVPVAAHPWAAVRDSLTLDNLRVPRRGRPRGSVGRSVKHVRRAAGCPGEKPAESKCEMDQQETTTNAAAQLCACGKANRHMGRCKGTGFPAKAVGTKAKPRAPKPLSTITKHAAAELGPSAVMLSIPAAALDRFWAKLPIEDKVRIVSREICVSLAEL